MQNACPTPASVRGASRLSPAFTSPLTSQNFHMENVETGMTGKMLHS